MKQKVFSSLLALFTLCIVVLSAGCGKSSSGTEKVTAYEHEWAIFNYPADWVVTNEIDYDDRNVHFTYFSPKKANDVLITFVTVADPSQSGENMDSNKMAVQSQHSDAEIKDFDFPEGAGFCAIYEENGKTIWDYALYAKGWESHFMVETDPDTKYNVEAVMDALISTYSFGL